MYVTDSLTDLQSFLLAHSGLLPMIGFVASGCAVLLLRGPITRLRTADIPEHESIMNFSSLGTLRCICGSDHADQPDVDRRQFCRSCGCEVVTQDLRMFERELSRREIQQKARSLRKAAIRARYRDLPPSITSVAELNRYLEGSETSQGRDEFSPPVKRGEPAAAVNHLFHVEHCYFDSRAIG